MLFSEVILAQKYRADHRDVPALPGQRRAGASSLRKSTLPNRAEERPLTIAGPERQRRRTPKPAILPPQDWSAIMDSCSPKLIQTMYAGFDDMVDGLAPASGAMEGGGAYNKHAKLQADASASALASWKGAVECIALDNGDRPIVIADYGSSQGKNSLAPMRVAVETVRSRVGPRASQSIPGNAVQSTPDRSRGKSP
jgi:hypothetical protein